MDPEPRHRRLHAMRREDSPDRSLPPPMASLSVIMGRGRAVPAAVHEPRPPHDEEGEGRGRGRGEGEGRDPGEEGPPPSMSQLNYNQKAEYAFLVEAGMEKIEVAQDSGFTNSEALIFGLNCMIRAGGLGNIDAVEFLKDFVDNHFPNTIPEDGPAYHSIRQRIEVIQIFLGMDEHERIIWRCALDNFLVMSGNKKSLPKKRFDEAVFSLVQDVGQGQGSLASGANVRRQKTLSVIIRQLLREALTISPYRDEVVEEAYCQTVVNFTLGRLTVEFDPEDMTEAEVERFKQAPIVEKLLAFPVKESTRYILKQELPRYIDRNGMRMLRSFVPFKELIIILTALFAYSINQFVSIMALCIFVPCFVALMIVTFLLLGTQDKAKKSFNVWARFLSQQKGIVVDTSASEVHELTQLSDYYIALFFLFVFNLFLFSGASEVIVLPEVLVGTSALMFALCVCVRKFWKQKSLLVAALVKSAIMVVSILHKAPAKFISDLVEYMLPEFIRTIPMVQSICNFLIATLGMIPNAIFGTVYAFLSVVHVAIFVLIVRQLIGSGKMHFYSISGPYFVASAWWVLWMVFFDYVMLKDSVNWVWLGVSHVPILIPFVVLSWAVDLAFQYGMYLAIFGFVLLVLFGMVACCHTHGKRVSRIPQLRYLKFEHLLLLFFTLPPLLLVLIFADVYVVTHHTQSPPAPVEWDHYMKRCGPEAWAERNMAVTQIECSSLIGRRSIDLYGRVASVKVHQRENTYETVFNKFSQVGQLKEAGYCFFGQKSDLCSSQSEESSTGDSSVETICGDNSRVCNLHHHSRFAFVIRLIEVGNGDREDSSRFASYLQSKSDEDAVSVDLVTTGNHKPSQQENILITNIIRNLRSGQLLRFNATYVDGLGSNLIAMKLESVSIEGTAAEWSYDSEEWKEMAKQEKYSQLSGFVVAGIKSSVRYLQAFVLGKVYF